ncbi:formyltransferase family protein [Neptuniibacter sp.]|uniref:formyltransferase family protein n=1 Tax=Neptuniibacter sp. TaxID=1962643 RepID=UPI002609E495|nr:formyltransferase family protein [Neptuniibacter sp.]MCP4595916.1 methionyl-tRNA formyltransferase [Neptuniibacter sp.]
MFKLIFLTGDHPRHLYIARALAKAGLLSKLIIERREHFIPKPPENISPKLVQLFTHHFAERERIEQKMFGPAKLPSCDTVYTTYDDLNSSDIKNFLEEEDPDLFLTYGCHKLTQETLEAVDGHKWNCHGGLSPWYKGAITHFWPSYMLEPQMTGMTVHELTQELDAGDVVHQCTAPLVAGDSLHQLGARAVVQLAEELPTLINLLKKKGALPTHKHKTNGMLWRSSAWRADHLSLIYEHYGDKIVDHYLEGNLIQSEPKIYRQFD